MVSLKLTKPAVFLDRDGVIIEEVNHLHHLDQVRLISGSGRSIKRLINAGYWVIVVTNQSVIARGLLDEDGLCGIHQVMTDKLAEVDGYIDRIYYCPHHPTAGYGKYKVDCNCRKPNPGMIQKAQSDFHINMDASWVVGDKISDIALGANLGLRNILVLTGHGKEHLSLTRSTYPDTLIVSDLSEAVKVILGENLS